MSREIGQARALLTRVESHLESPGAIPDLEKALGILEELLEPEAGETSELARNIAQTYAEALFHEIEGKLVKIERLTEPELRHYFEVLNTIEKSPFALPSNARETKIKLVGALIEILFEGHPPETKAKAMNQLVEVAGKSNK